MAYNRCVKLRGKTNRPYKVVLTGSCITKNSESGLSYR
jgi:hypothetical protein